MAVTLYFDGDKRRIYEVPEASTYTADANKKIAAIDAIDFVRSSSALTDAMPVCDVNYREY